MRGELYILLWIVAAVLFVWCIIFQLQADSLYKEYKKYKKEYPFPSNAILCREIVSLICGLTALLVVIFRIITIILFGC